MNMESNDELKEIDIKNRSVLIDHNILIDQKS